MALRSPESQLPERVDWQTFSESYLHWRQGQHVAIIAPTDAGKTTLMRSLLWERDWVVVLCSKKKDASYSQFLSEGYTRSPKWPPPPPPKEQLSQHVLLWPEAKTLEDLRGFAPVFRRCLQEVFVDENWAVALDDLYYLCVKLGLKAEIEDLNYQVRSIGVSLVASMQRPAWVPRSCWDQSSHGFIGPMTDLDDLRTVRGLFRASTKELEVWTRNLRQHEWLYCSSRIDRPAVIVRPPA